LHESKTSKESVFFSRLWHTKLGEIENRNNHLVTNVYVRSMIN